MENNGMFERMCHEAIDELTSGEKGWKEIDQNTLMLACFGMMYNHMYHKLVKPMWVGASGICSAVIFYVVRGLIGF